MKFGAKEISGITVITLEGNVLGGPDATELNNTLHKLLDARKKKVVVDLKGVSSMNSSGLGMLIGGVTTMRNAKGDLKLACASEKIIRLLEVTKLLSVFEHYDSVKKAVESY
ncbi:MAG TPA: STAS domain-containing protein [Bacteroidota bacterium]|nr:STAS domain-containing protein [Bacteroidota bacterium]